MSTTKIMVIRQAEKPNSEPGIMPDGAENPEALTATGWKRADALVGLFAPTGGASPRPALAKPESLFASGSESLRPKQMITPLAAALALTIATFLKGQEEKLIEAAKKASGPTLISWQHEAIPRIAPLTRGGTEGVPPRWPGRRFDLVRMFDLEGDGNWSFAQAPQLLLPSDSSKLVALND